MNTKVNEGKLISGKDALIALANGEEVEACVTQRTEKDKWHWFNAKSLTVSEIEAMETEGDPDGENIRAIAFRLKPKTIKLNGIEVPVCGSNYQQGETIFVFDDCCDGRGYTEYSASGYQYQNSIPKLWWRTEEEIKQVVAALHQVFGGSHDN